MNENLPLPNSYISNNENVVKSVNGKTGDVDLRNVMEYKSNSESYDLSLINVENHIIYNQINSTAILPYNPLNGLVLLIMNYGTGKITVMAQNENMIETFGHNLQLVNRLDKIKLIFNNNIWNII